jgi:hypothetical protein
MPGFSPAQYEGVVNALVSGTNTLAQKVTELPAAAAGTLNNWLVPGVIKESLAWLVEKACEVGKWVLDKIADLLKGAVAPLRMYYDAYQWTDVRGLCTGVAGVLKDTNLTVDDVWKGSAKDAYVKHMTAHSSAAARCGSIADRTVVSLNVCASAGLAFYVAVGALVGKLIAEFVGAIIAVSSGVFAWVAFATIADSGITGGMIWGLVAALTAFLGTQISQLIALHGEASDIGSFPGGRWPVSGAATFADATFKDGDADWYLREPQR